MEIQWISIFIISFDGDGSDQDFLFFSFSSVRWFHVSWAVNYFCFSTSLSKISHLSLSVV